MIQYKNIIRSHVLNYKDEKFFLNSQIRRKEHERGKNENLCWREMKEISISTQCQVKNHGY